MGIASHGHPLPYAYGNHATLRIGAHDMRTSLAIAMVAATALGTFALGTVAARYSPTVPHVSAPTITVHVSSTVTRSPVPSPVPSAMVTCDSYDAASVEIDGHMVSVQCIDGAGMYPLARRRYDGVLVAGNDL